MDEHRYPKIEITFSPAWWTAKYGMDFSSAKEWQDPILYTERDQEQRRLLYERFGDVGLGEINPLPNPLVGVEYGHRFMSAFWDCEVIYLPGQWPHATPLPDAETRCRNLAVPDVENSLAVQLARKNAHILEERYGRVKSAVNFGGPLNNAVSVLGEAVFALCAGEPELAKRVLFQMGEAVLRLHDRMECPINQVPAGQERQMNWGIGNCPVGQVSPRMYQDVVLPVDLWFRDNFSWVDFSLHHCGVFHPYAEAYLPLQPTDIDVGPGSDLHLTRKYYPDARISAYFDPAEFASFTQARIDQVVIEMIEAVTPGSNPVNESRGGGSFTYIRAIEVGPELSDQSVRDMMTVFERIKKLMIV
jgi:hypothetical protein